MLFTKANQQSKLSGSVMANVDLSKWTLKNPTTSSYPSVVTYYIGILATEGLHSAYDTLNVTIRDVMQPPVFLNLPASISIAETTPPNTVIFKVLHLNSLLRIQLQKLWLRQCLPFGIHLPPSISEYGLYTRFVILSYLR